MRDDEQGDAKHATDAARGEASARADEPKVCGNCGAGIETKEWHPLVTRTDDDGRFRVYAFCDGTCRDEWTGD